MHCSYRPQRLRALKSSVGLQCTKWPYIVLLGGFLFWRIAMGASAEITVYPFVAHYSVSKGIIVVGDTTRTLRKNNDGHYIFESITEPAGIAKVFASGKIIEQSTWHIVENRIRPIIYVYQNSNSTKSRDVRLEFNWTDRKVVNIINGDPWQMTIHEDTLDKLLYQVALMVELQQGKDTFQYQIADGGKIKTYNIRVLGTETVETELGKFETVKIVRDEKKPNTTIWCGKDINFIPVKFEKRKNDGTVITAEITSLEGVAIPPSAKPLVEPAAAR